MLDMGTWMDFEQALQNDQALQDSFTSVVEELIRSGVAVSKSTWQRLPLYAVAPLSNPAQDYEALAKEVLGNG